MDGDNRYRRPRRYIALSRVFVGVYGGLFRPGRPLGLVLPCGCVGLHSRCRMWFRCEVVRISRFIVVVGA